MGEWSCVEYHNDGVELAPTSDTLISMSGELLDVGFDLPNSQSRFCPFRRLHLDSQPEALNPEIPRKRNRLTP